LFVTKVNTNPGNGRTPDNQVLGLIVIYRKRVVTWTE